VRGVLFRRTVANEPRLQDGGRGIRCLLRLLPQSVVDANNRRAQVQAQKVADVFAESFAKGTCPVCKNALTSYAKETPCLHWLLKPEGFEKDDFPPIAERYSLTQIELFVRCVANQEVIAKNINDMASEGTGKLVELTAKYKNLEWAISCAKSDYEGHGNSEESQRPHYHFQMRIDGQRFIDYNDHHLPLHHSDILTITCVWATRGTRLIEGRAPAIMPEPFLYPAAIVSDQRSPNSSRLRPAPAKLVATLRNCPAL
jgi:hypothetical protein